jgi:uncharacterized protein (TIGR00730 family)
MNIRSVAVFCGSQKGNNPEFIRHAIALGKQIALFKLKLIYGGGKKGLMGVLADAVLAGGGEVTGIIPELLTRLEQQHETLTELAIVADMHTRKKMLYEKADAAIVLPGGFGTLDELFEILTWNQLKLHDKKIFLLNSGGFYTHLYKHLQFAQSEGFLYDDIKDRIAFCQTPEEIFLQLD